MRTRPGCWECLRSDFHSTFSPEGRLFQVEYSLEAIKLGSTAIGVGINFSLSTLPMSPWYSSKSLMPQIRAVPYCVFRHRNPSVSALPLYLQVLLISKYHVHRSPPPLVSYLASKNESRHLFWKPPLSRRLSKLTDTLAPPCPACKLMPDP